MPGAAATASEIGSASGDAKFFARIVPVSVASTRCVPQLCVTTSTTSRAEASLTSRGVTLTSTTSTPDDTRSPTPRRIPPVPRSWPRRLVAPGRVS
jgi:hypothetical protein